MPFPKEEDRCTFTYVDGRRCRMQKIETHPYLCFYHWQRGQEANDAVVFASQLLEPEQKLNSPAAVIDVLSGVFRLLAQSRLQARQAATLAYVCQLVLQALPQAEKQQRAAADGRGETSDVFDTIQKGSFEESIVLKMLNKLRGKSGPEQAPPLASESASFDDPEAEPASLRIPGTSIILPPPLQRETAPPASHHETSGQGAAPSSVPSPHPPPELETELREAGRHTPEEDLQRREERARDFGPPILITRASEKRETDAHRKKRN